MRKSKNCKQVKKTAPSCDFDLFSNNRETRFFVLKIVKNHKKCGFYGTPSGNLMLRIKNNATLIANSFAFEFGLNKSGG